jgi:hypothetical protein
MFVAPASSAAIDVLVLYFQRRRRLSMCFRSLYQGRLLSALGRSRQIFHSCLLRPLPPLRPTSSWFFTISDDDSPCVSVAGALSSAASSNFSIHVCCARVLRCDRRSFSSLLSATPPSVTIFWFFLVLMRLLSSGTSRRCWKYHHSMMLFSFFAVHQVPETCRFRCRISSCHMLQS